MTHMEVFFKWQPFVAVVFIMAAKEEVTLYEEQGSLHRKEAGLIDGPNKQMFMLSMKTKIS